MTTCQVILDDGPVTVNLTAEWDPFSADITTSTGFFRFLGRNAISRASLYWGESLLANHRVQLSNDLESVDDGRSKAEVTFTQRGGSEDITDRSFFNVSWRSIRENVEGAILALLKGQSRMARPSRPLAQSIATGLSARWRKNLAKSFMSVILTDLGQTTTEQNILTAERLLQHFTADFPEAVSRQQPGSGTALEDYDSLKDTTGPLVVAPATLAVSYLCNVPRRKPWSELIVSILVADLVFMRALWSIFTFAMSSWLKAKDKTGNWCEGCLQAASNPNQEKFEDTAVLPDDISQASIIPLLRMRR